MLALYPVLPFRDLGTLREAASSNSLGKWLLDSTGMRCLSTLSKHVAEAGNAPGFSHLSRPPPQGPFPLSGRQTPSSLHRCNLLTPNIVRFNPPVDPIKMFLNTYSQMKIRRVNKVQQLSEVAVLEAGTCLSNPSGMDLLPGLRGLWPVDSSPETTPSSQVSHIQ